MNKNTNWLLVLMCLCLTYVSASAQSSGISVSTSNPVLTDTSKLNLEQLKDKYKNVSGDDVAKFKEYQNMGGASGMPGSGKVPKSAGVTPTETGPTMISGGYEEEGNTKEKQQEAANVIDPGNEAQETAEKIIEAVASENKEDLEQVPIFGFRYFRETKTKLYSSAQDVRPPENYVLGIGDQLNIAIWGFADYNEVFTIEKEGYIQPKYVGRIYLKGLKLENAREVIKARYSRAYMIENSQFDVTLNYSRVINVNVVGEVEIPGSYTIPAVNTVYNLLSYIGGPSPIGSIRNIEIKRNGVVIRKFDLYKFLNNPDKQDDYFLQNNDYIYVPVSQKLVIITGEVVRPFKYELLESEGYEDLIKYAGGYKPTALKKYIQIKRFVNDKAIYLDVDIDSIKKAGGELKLLNGDLIMVRAIPEKAKNFVTLSGPVYIPGEYEIKEGDRIRDIIERAQGFTDDIYMKEAYIIRNNEDKTDQTIRFNLTNAMENPDSEDNILLNSKDRIRLFSVNYFFDNFSISIGGAVRNPTSFTLQEGLTLKDAILICGGLQPFAYTKRAYISRKDKTDNSTYYFTVELDTSNSMISLDSVLLQPNDKITILSNLTFTQESTVSISGSVQNPGVFELWRDFNLKDMVLLAGGFTEKALLKNVLVYRRRPDFKDEVLTLALDTNDFYSTLESFQLQRGDRIIVFSSAMFENSYNVSIAGYVKDPGSFALKENMSLADLLLLANGFTMQAASNRIEVARVSNFKEAIMNNDATEITIDYLEISKEFLEDPVARSYMLKPLDQVFIRKIPDFEFQRRVYLGGQVKYPGTYVLTSKIEKVSDLIERSGGLTTQAFPEGALMERAQQNTGMLLLDLKKALRRKGSKYNYILEDGDRISIPVINNIVKIRGQIDHPFEETDMKRLAAVSDTITPEEYIALTPEKKANVPYSSGKRAKYYIKEYGAGFGAYARKKDTYVVLPNGQVKDSKFILFGRLYPKVTKGSTIVVPREELKYKKIKKKQPKAKSGVGLENFIKGTIGTLTSALTLYLLIDRITE